MTEIVSVDQKSFILKEKSQGMFIVTSDKFEMGVSGEILIFHYTDIKKFQEKC